MQGEENNVLCDRIWEPFLLKIENTKRRQKGKGKLNVYKGIKKDRKGKLYWGRKYCKCIKIKLYLGL